VQTNFSQGKYPSFLAWIPAMGGVLAVPPLALALQPLPHSSFGYAMVLLGAQYLFSECWLGPGMTLLQSLVRDHGDDGSVLSTAIGLILAVNTLTASAAPALIAQRDDGTAAGLRSALLAVLCLSYAGSSVAFAFLARRLGAPSNAGGGDTGALGYCLKKNDSQGQGGPVVFLDSISANKGGAGAPPLGKYQQQQMSRDGGMGGSGSRSGSSSSAALASPRKGKSSGELRSAGGTGER